MRLYLNLIDVVEMEQRMTREGGMKEQMTRTGKRESEAKYGTPSKGQRGSRGRHKY